VRAMNPQFTARLADPVLTSKLPVLVPDTKDVTERNGAGRTRGSRNISRYPFRKKEGTSNVLLIVVKDAKGNPVSNNINYGFLVLTFVSS
jgi:hypothetical protein